MYITKTRRKSSRKAIQGMENGEWIGKKPTRIGLSSSIYEPPRHLPHRGEHMAVELAQVSAYHHSSEASFCTGPASRSDAWHTMSTKAIDYSFGRFLEKGVASLLKRHRFGLRPKRSMLSCVASRRTGFTPLSMHRFGLWPKRSMLSYVAS